MEVQLTKKLGTRGTAMSDSWVATVSNDDGDIAFRESAITAPGALTALERKIEEALAAVREMRPGSPSDRR